MCCDSENEVLIDGRSWSRFCLLAVGVVGVIGTFSLPVTYDIPCADSCTIICACPPTTPLQVRYILAVMTGDCGDEIPSKSKPQPAGVTSCVNFENVLRVRYLQTSSFRFLLYFPRISRMFSKLVCKVSDFFHFVDVLLVFANPDDLCGNFFFFLNCSSFPSASTLSRNCSSAAPPRYCFPEISLPIELLTV